MPKPTTKTKRIIFRLNEGQADAFEEKCLANEVKMSKVLRSAISQYLCPTKVEWIKCSERMPTGNDPVLVYIRDGYQIIAFKEPDRWVWEGESWFLSEGLYWMPLPPNPF